MATNFFKTGVCLFFLKLILCGLLVCVCPRLRLLITSGMIQTSYDWLNKFYSCYLATVAIIIVSRVNNSG